MARVIAAAHASAAEIDTTWAAFFADFTTCLSGKTAFESDFVRKITCVEAMFASALIAELCH